MFQMLSVFAEFERSIIQERVRADLQRARKEGKRLGRPPMSPKMIERVQEALLAPGRTEGVRKIAKRLGVNPTSVQAPFGDNPKGILILDASGRYADIEMRSDRPKFKESPPFRLNTPAAEFGEAAKAFGANFGTWSVNEADKTLIRRFEGALVPNNEGTVENKDTISLTGDELKLVGATGGIVGTGVVGTDVLRRAK